MGGAGVSQGASDKQVGQDSGSSSGSGGGGGGGSSGGPLVSSPATQTGGVAGWCKKAVDANCNGIYDRFSPEGQDCSEPDRTGVDFSPSTCFYEKVPAKIPGGNGSTDGDPGGTASGPGVKAPAGVILKEAVGLGGGSTVGHSIITLVTGQSYAVGFITPAAGGGGFFTCEAIGFASVYSEMSISRAPGDFNPVDNQAACRGNAGPYGRSLSWHSHSLPVAGACRLQPNVKYYYNIRPLGTHMTISGPAGKCPDRSMPCGLWLDYN